MADQRNMTIISLRGMGKSALIRHLFAIQGKLVPIVVDIYRTADQARMVLRVVVANLRQLSKPASALLKEAAQAMLSLEFRQEFDAITGEQEIGVSIRPGNNDARALNELFSCLDAKKKPRVTDVFLEHWLAEG